MALLLNILFIFFVHLSINFIMNFIFLKKVFVFIFYVYRVLSECILVYYMHAEPTKTSRDGSRSPGIGITVLLTISPAPNSSCFYCDHVTA